MTVTGLGNSSFGNAGKGNEGINKQVKNLSLELEKKGQWPGGGQADGVDK
jgi:hypothetical protein